MACRVMPVSGPAPASRRRAQSSVPDSYHSTSRDIASRLSSGVAGRPVSGLREMAAASLTRWMNPCSMARSPTASLTFLTSNVSGSHPRTRNVMTCVSASMEWVMTELLFGFVCMMYPFKVFRRTELSRRVASMGDGSGIVKVISVICVTLSQIIPAPPPPPPTYNN